MVRHRLLSRTAIPFISLADHNILSTTTHTRMIARILLRGIWIWKVEWHQESKIIQAAVILSASVTLMTLPGLSGIARIAGLVVIMCSVLSMIMSFISIVKYKAELTHGTPTSGSKGFVLLSGSVLLLASLRAHV